MRPCPCCNGIGKHTYHCGWSSDKCDACNGTGRIPCKIQVVSDFKANVLTEASWKEGGFVAGKKAELNRILKIIDLDVQVTVDNNARLAIFLYQKELRRKIQEEK